MSTATQIPRNFLLLDAVNKSGTYTHATYGLVDESIGTKYENNFIKMEYWNATLVYDDGNEISLLSLEMRCTENYPEERPIITFSEDSLKSKRVSKLCDSDGNLTSNAVLQIKWNIEMSLGDYLSEVLRAISYYGF